MNVNNMSRNAMSQDRLEYLKLQNKYDELEIEMKKR
jgi:hypothetical protein